MTLFEECLQALKTCGVLSLDESKRAVAVFEKDFKITQWGRVDWECYPNKYRVFSEKDIQVIMQEKLIPIHQPVQIIWDEASLPVIECLLENVLQVIDDVTAVSFDTWIYSSLHKFVIEYYHEGEVMIGFGK